LLPSNQTKPNHVACLPFELSGNLCLSNDFAHALLLLLLCYTGSSDPYVQFAVGPWNASSRVIHANLNPVWNESFMATVNDPKNVWLARAIGYIVHPLCSPLMTPCWFDHQPCCRTFFESRCSTRTRLVVTIRWVTPLFLCTTWFKAPKKSFGYGIQTTLVCTEHNASHANALCFLVVWCLFADYSYMPRIAK
jgi:hypothetical protein